MGKFEKLLQVTPGIPVDLKSIDPDFTGGFDKESAAATLADDLRKLFQLQYRLYAENRRSLLVVFQAMDAGGKDGVINHVISALNPQGCRVTSFKVPTAVESAHDFLWRCHQAAPATGEIAVFNRSHYEDVLVTRVHRLISEDELARRYQAINRFEELLAERGTRIVKFFLHIDADEQLRRFAARLDAPEKNWKISEADYREREYWADYQQAFEMAFKQCSTAIAPWYVIPANHKWFRNLAVAEILSSVLESMDLRMPEPPENLAEIRQLAAAELAKLSDRERRAEEE